MFGKVIWRPDLISAKGAFGGFAGLKFVCLFFVPLK